MISYYFEDTDFIFKGKTVNNRWLRLVAESEIRRIGDISIIFCSDNYILDVNQKYLQHDYFTDIITFDYCEGDVFPVTSSSVSIQCGRMLLSTVLNSRMNLTESLSMVYFIL